MGSLKQRVRTTLGPRGIATAKRWLARLLPKRLKPLGRLYGTNKTSSAQNYTPFYELHLAHLRRRPVALLEIGIGGYEAGPHAGGSSLRMWRSWMPRARVIGLDLGPRDFREPRITTIAGDQSDPEFLAELARDVGPFDVIIDDGSHRSDHVITSFRALFPTMPSGGIYVIEDLHCSYWADYGGGPPGSSGTSVEMIKQLIDDPTLGGPVESVCVYPKIAFIRKR